MLKVKTSVCTVLVNLPSILYFIPLLSMRHGAAQINMLIIIIISALAYVIAIRATYLEIDEL